MEALKSQKAHILTTLSRELETYQDKVADVIDECKSLIYDCRDTELISLIDASTADKAQQERHQALEKARQDARKIAALEREVAYLRSADPEYKDAGVQCSGPNDNDTAEQPKINLQPPAQLSDASLPIEEKYKELEQKYSKLESEWIHAAAARDVLENKCRSHKKHLRAWAAYTKDWHSEKGTRTARTPSSVAETEDLGSRVEAVRASSAPTPTLATNAASPSSAPRATSVNVPLESGEWCASAPASDDHEEPELPRSHSEEFQAQVCSDSTETSDGSKKLTEVKDRLGGQESTSVLSGLLSEDAGGSSPVVVSARPVKRKRARESSLDINVKKSLHNEVRAGTVEQPVRIKSDQSSSSPSAVARFKAADDHDTMDLDELGAKTPTPRKRQRLLPRSIQFTADENYSSPRDDLDLFDTDAEIPEGLRDKPSSLNLRAGTSLTLDEEACKKAGKEYAAELWKQQQARMKSLQGLVEKENGLPEHIQGNSKRARAYQHNQKLHQRQAENHATFHETSYATSRVSKTPKGTIYRDQSGNEALGGLPTPISTVKRPDLALGPSDFDEQHRTPSVLRPTDPNNQVLPRTGDSIKKRLPPPSRRDHGASAVHALSEDGDMEEKQLRRDKAKSSRAADSEHRLENLLTKRSPEKLSYPGESPTKTKKTYSRKADGPTTDVSKSISKATPVTPQQGSKSATSVLEPAKKNSSAARAREPVERKNFTDFEASTTTAPAGRRSVSHHGQRLIDKLNPTPHKAHSPIPKPSPKPPTSPEKGPIRSRPLDTLDRKHFKPNPAHNGGFSYAYREVIRKQADRKCMPGCRRPDCCGDRIRKMIAIGGALPSNHTNLFSSSPDEPETDGAEDHRLLKEYMGDNYRSWKKMTEDQKKEEWMRAQEWNFGKTFGRHKDNGRQATPPGFWRVEMASTQEMEEDEREAERMEKERVDGMWREAMRKGGAWVFADE